MFIRLIFLALIVNSLLSEHGAESTKPKKAYHWRERRGLTAYNTGCCNDRLECVLKDHQTAELYMGVDAAFKDRKSGEYYERSSIVYRSIYAQFSKFTDDMRFDLSFLTKISEESRHPQTIGYILSFWCSPQLLKFENHQWKQIEEGEKAKVVDERSRIKAGMWYKDMYHIVCDKEVLLLKNAAQGKSKTNASDALIDSINSKDCTNKLLHPALCTANDQDDLIDVVALPAKNATYVVGFYGTSQVRGAGRYEREYTIKVWKEAKLVSSTKRTGTLSAITYHKVGENEVKGVYYTNDGHVCPYAYDRKAIPTNFEAPEGDNKYTGCTSIAQLINCPQPWCYDQKIGASFTVKEKDGKYVYFITGLFFWKVPERELPLNVPRSKTAIFTGDQHPCKESEFYAPKGEYLVCVEIQAEAAFAVYTDSGDEYVFMYRYGWSVIKNKNKGDFKYRAPHFKGLESTAGWYNAKERSAYIFTDDRYTVFKLTGDPFEIDSWKQTENGTVADLGIATESETKPEIDSVISVEGKGYFVDSKYRFYEVPEDNVKTDEKRTWKLTYTDLFSTRSDCYYNDMPAYYNLLKRYNDSREEKVYGQKYIVMKKTEVSRASRSYTFIFIAVAVGLGIITIGWTAMFICGRGRSKQPVVTNVKVKRPKSQKVNSNKS